MRHRSILILVSSLALALSSLIAPGAQAGKPSGGGGSSPTTTRYSGEAYNLKASLLDGLLPGVITIDPFPHAVLTNSDPDGVDDHSVLKIDQSLSPIPVAVTLGLLDASVYGSGDQTVAFADVVGNGKTKGAQGPATIVINPGPMAITIQARVLSAEARSMCVGSTAVGSYDVSVADLDIRTPGPAPFDHISIADPIPDQVISLGPLGYVAIGEHSFSGGTQTATALHVHVTNPLNLVDVVISSASATINCGGNPPPPPPECTFKDFVTGGGWIGDKQTFGFNGGQKPNGLHGHLTWLDHETGKKYTGTTLTKYEITGATQRRLTYSGDVDGTPSTIVFTVEDNGEPGKGVDKVAISSSADGYSKGLQFITRGNIQLHKPGGCQTTKKGQ